MSGVIDSGDLDESSEAVKVDNVEENSSCSQDATVITEKAIEDCNCAEDSGVIRQDEILSTADQQSADVERDRDQNGAQDMVDSRSSDREDKLNDPELDKDAPIQDQESKLSEVDSDSRPRICEEKSNDGELERDTPMESEENDNQSGQL